MIDPQHRVAGFDVSWEKRFQACAPHAHQINVAALLPLQFSLSGMDAAWPKPLAVSVYDSPPGQQTTNKCGQTDHRRQTPL